MPRPLKAETEFEKFERLARRIVAVPKREADELAKREKAAKKKAATPSTSSPRVA
jgi:hypothetical protein